MIKTPATGPPVAGVSLFFADVISREGGWGGAEDYRE